MSDITLVDLGLGNLYSVIRSLERAGAKVQVQSDPDSIRQASRVVVPGQGAFRDCSAALKRGVGEALNELLKRGVPYLGICLGMQLLFEASEEGGKRNEGLGYLAGEVRRFPDDMREHSSGRRLKVPHMGWNTVSSEHPMLNTHPWFYFLHSYYCVPSDPTHVIAETTYGTNFCSVVAKDNLFACQFHPEKSHRNGHLLLETFLNDY